MIFYRSSNVYVILCWLGLVALANSTIPSDQKSTSKHPIILIFGFDGFRYDYLERGFNPFLMNITKNGVSTDYFANVFPTKTLTNFFSIATGMYAETHGVLGNKVFHENGTCLKYGYELYHYNDDIVPMWTLNEMSGEGRHSGCLMWSGCDFPFQNVNLTYFQKLDKSIPWTKRIDMIMTWLLNPDKPVNLLNAYFEQPDSSGHMTGPCSKETDEKLKQVDDILIYFYDQLDKYPKLKEQINLIILSDHGMIEVKTDEINNIFDFLDEDKYTKCGDFVKIQILPKQGFEKEVYENLTSAANSKKTFTVYKNEQQPDTWHVKNNRRNIGLHALANPYYLLDYSFLFKGAHGYVTELKEMRGFFTAIGPIFKQNYHTTWLHNIDVYPLIAQVLRLQLRPEHVKPNGTLTKIADILK